MLEPELQIHASGFQHENRVSGELLEVNYNSDKVNNKLENPQKRVVKRGKRNSKNAKLNIVSTNAASLRSKLKSFRSELKRSKAAVFTLQETHYATKGKVNITDFEVFEAIRKGKQKGGTMVGVHKALRPVLITELNDPFELVVVEIKAGNREIRIMSGYGPQESWSTEQKEPFFQALEEEIIKTDLAGKSVVIEADFNSKLGAELSQMIHIFRTKMEACWQTS